MRPEDQIRYPPVTTALKDGREITLRLLSTHDAEALGDFYDSMPRATWRFYCPPRLTRQDAAWRAKWATTPTFVCVVAEDEAGGRIVGYNWYQWKDDQSRESVFGICIREEYRGVGLGRALMTRLLAIGREIGPAVMSLTVQLANPRAVALYQKMGFRIIRQQMRSKVADFPAEPEYYMEQEMRMDELNEGLSISIDAAEQAPILAAGRDQLAAWETAMPPVTPLVLDFGLGRFNEVGLIEYWIANEVEEGYCGKYLFVFDGQTCPAHSHRDKHETFFIVKGTVVMRAGGETFEMKPGDVLPVEPGTVHSFTGKGPALLLEVSKPSIIADNYFEDTSIPIGGNYVSKE
jgi:ribosomal protein S18 acetylase RimI-like enzyme/mannose-6-phosphate isomerase-like protein (cupin superfamily)